MAGSNPARRNGESIDDFMTRRRREVAARDSSAEAASHEALGRAARSGQDLHLPTTSDVKAFGARLNRNPATVGAAGAIADNVGFAGGVVRGGFHTMEGMPDAAKFGLRMINPLDPVLSLAGRSVSQDLSRNVAAAIDHGVAYAGSVITDHSKLSRDLDRAGRQIQIDYNRNATPAASTAKDEYRRRSRIAANGGELAFNVASFATLAPEINALVGFGRIPKAVRVARYVEAGWTPDEASYLAQPYGNKRMGSHYKGRAEWKKKFGEGPISKALMNSSINVLRPSHLDIHGQNALHYAVDPAMFGTRTPNWFTKGWSGKKLGLEKFGPVGRAVIGAPDAVKSMAGGISGFAGGLAYDLQDEDHRP